MGLFIDPIRSAIYRLAPGPVKTAQDLAYYGQNAKALGLRKADGAEILPEDYQALASGWASGNLDMESDANRAQLDGLNITANLQGRENELLNRTLNALYSGGQAVAIPGIGAAMGAGLWNSMVNSDMEVNGGDMARAAAVLGAVGGIGLTGLRMGTGRVPTFVGGGHSIAPGIVLANQAEREMLLREALGRKVAANAVDPTAAVVS